MHLASIVAETCSLDFYQMAVPYRVNISCLTTLFQHFNVQKTHTVKRFGLAVSKRLTFRRASRKKLRKYFRSSKKMTFGFNSVLICSIKSYQTVNRNERNQRPLKISCQNSGFSNSKSLRLPPEFCIRCRAVVYSLGYM